MKVNIQIIFDRWKDINTMYFDTNILLNEKTIIDGKFYYRIDLNKHFLSKKLKIELMTHGIFEEDITRYLNDKTFEFEL